MLRAVYDWTLAQAGRPHATVALALVAFVDSSFFPVPPFVLMIPMVLAQPNRAWKLAALCTISSVLGGLLGYAIGDLLYEQVAKPILAFYGHEGSFDGVAADYAKHGPWIVLLGGLTPFPFKIFAIASGAAHMNLWLFLLSSAVARATRFFAVAALLYFLGPKAREIIEKRLPWVFGAFAVVLVLGVIALRFLR